MKILVIFPHPDDEVYGPGGTLARYAAEGHDIRLVTLTRGEAGSLGICKTMEKEEKAEMRVAELQAAVKILGLSQLEQLSLPDKQLAEYPEQEGIALVQAEIETYRPDLLITFHDSGVSSHPDHIAVAKWCRIAVEEATFKTQLFYYGINTEQAEALQHIRNVVAFRSGEITHAIDVETYYAVKLKAIECHVSQLDLLQAFETAEGGYKPIGIVEYFSRPYPLLRTEALFDDLFLPR